MTDERDLPRSLEGSDRSGLGTACPPRDTLSAYLDGRLNEVEKGPIEDHVSRCNDCYFVVTETAAVLAELDGTSLTSENSGVPSRTGPPRHFASIQLLRMAAILLVGFGALTIWRLTTTPKDPLRAQLAEAVGARRFFDGRLTGGFRFGERIAPMRGPGGVASADWGVLAAAAKVRGAIPSPNEPGEMSTLASAHLVLGEFDEAVRLFERATQIGKVDASGEARLRSDLSAAYLSRGAATDRADDFPKALEQASRAVELDGSLVEARFNKAVALEALFLPKQAVRAWDEFLARETDPEWRAEASRRRDAQKALPSSTSSGSG